MKLLKTLFLCESTRSSARAWASVSGAGSFIALARAMERGTMPSISARREASPMTDSMWRSPASSMPIWRGMNSDVFSSSPRGRADCISMEGGSVWRSRVLGERGVGGLVHQPVQFGGVGDLDLEEPALAQRVAVGQCGVGAQRLVDF